MTTRVELSLSQVSINGHPLYFQSNLLTSHADKTGRSKDEAAHGDSGESVLDKVNLPCIVMKNSSNLTPSGQVRRRHGQEVDMLQQCQPQGEVMT